MAIVLMNKFAVAGLAYLKERFVNDLMKLGAAEINERKEELNTLYDAMAYESELNKAETALKVLDEFDRQKKALFAVKPLVDEHSLYEFEKNSNEVKNYIDSLISKEARIAEISSGVALLDSRIYSLQPWINLDVAFEELGTAFADVIPGTFPSFIRIEALKEELKQQMLSFIVTVSDDGEQHYVVVFSHREHTESVVQILTAKGFSALDLKNLSGTPQSIIDSLTEQKRQLIEEYSRVKEEIMQLVPNRLKIQAYCDYLRIAIDKKNALDNAASTNKAFVISGWIPEEESEKLNHLCQKYKDIVLIIKKPEKDEEIPILLKNNSFAEPFEIITEQYSMPSNFNIDPTAIMAPFYFIFFGMMVSDAGYGILLTLLMAFVLYKFKPKGKTEKFIRFLLYGGISTFIWGALFGGWFGDLPLVVSQGRHGIKAIWFNPIDDPIKLLIVAFLFGAVHIFTGMGIKAYLLIKEGKIFDAVFDIGSWFVLLPSLVLLLAGTTPDLKNIGKYGAIVSAAALVLTQGRNEKNIVKRFLSGVLSLYGVTGYLSDVLSYSRVLALGLSTGVIASVINTIGSLFGFNVLGIVVLILVVVFGTVFNIAISALGAYVHTSRLQYVEFFSKFFEGGGKPFKPFKINTKYVQIIDRSDLANE